MRTPVSGAQSVPTQIEVALAIMGYPSIDAFDQAVSAMTQEQRAAEVHSLGALLGATE